MSAEMFWRLLQLAFEKWPHRLTVVVGTRDYANTRCHRRRPKSKRYQRMGQGERTPPKKGTATCNGRTGKGQDKKQGKRTGRKLRNRCSMLRCTGQRNVLDSDTNALRECVRTRSTETRRHVDKSVHMTVRLWFSAQLFRHVLDQFQLT